MVHVQLQFSWKKNIPFLNCLILNHLIRHKASLLHFYSCSEKQRYWCVLIVTQLLAALAQEPKINPARSEWKAKSVSKYASIRDVARKLGTAAHIVVH